MRPVGGGGAEPRLDAETGSISAFVAVLAAALILVAGLVFDGGSALVAKRRAINLAEQAARAGAERLNQGALHGAVFQLDPASAAATASSYLAATGEHGDVNVSGNQVEVSVAWSVRTSLLGLIGIGELSGDGSASADNVHGVVTEEG